MSVSAPSAKTILFLAANPKNTMSLRLGEEVRNIDEVLRRSNYRERFVLEQRWAVRAEDVQQSLLDLKPQIIHFSGHGVGAEGLIFEDNDGYSKPMDGETLAHLFELAADFVECVLLNACYSGTQAALIAQYVPYVMGMSQDIGDTAALKFSSGFYNALGSGSDVEHAYGWGCNSIRMAGIQEYRTPVLLKNPVKNVQAKPSVSRWMSLSTWERNQLEQDRENLQNVYETYTEKIRRLTSALAIETDVMVRLKYEQQVQQEQKARDGISHKIQAINGKLQ
jgi:hypothetical protein